MSDSFRCWLLLLVFFVGIGSIPRAEAGFLTQKGTPEERFTEPCEPPQHRGIAPELVEACKDVASRLLAEARKGAEARFNPEDKRFLDTCRTATRARNVNVVATGALAGHAPPEHTQRLAPELFRVAAETSERILDEFNEHGASAKFGREDVEVLEVFLTAVLALRSIKAAESPAPKEGTNPELVRKAKEAAERILAECNRRGYEAKFNASDLETLRQFGRTLGENY